MRCAAVAVRGATFPMILESRGAVVLGGMAIRRDNLVGGAQEFVERLVAALHS